MAHVSPSKGKGREASRVSESGWWDFWPLISSETPKRPLQWSTSSIMFTPEPASPRVLGCTFNKSNVFALTPPLNAPKTAYLPPTCILVSPTEEFVFAFIPGRDVDGIGCIWVHGATSEHWEVAKCWLFPRGAGVVGGQWLGNSRQWGFGPEGTLVRLPPQGPRIPAADHVLLLVTEDHQVHLKYSRPEISRGKPIIDFKSLQASLLRPNTTVETRGAVPEPAKPIHDMLCFDAAIGLHFSETRIYVAHRSRCINFSSSTEARAFDMGVGVGLGTTSIQAPDWELIGQEPMIHLSAIDLHLRGTSVVMDVNPLPPITNIPSYVTQMSFMSFPPEEAKTATEDSQEVINNFFLGVSTSDIKDFDTSVVKSALHIYTFAHSASTNILPSRTWKLRNSAVLDGALAFFAPAIQASTMFDGIAHIGVLDMSGKSLKQTRKNETAVGSIRVFNIPSLTENTYWESTPIWSSVFARGLPHAGSISPNHKLIWEPSFSVWFTQSSIETLPQPLQGHSEYAPNAISLALALQSKKAVSDIIQVLSRPSVRIQEAATCVKQALKLLRSVPLGAQFPVICEVIGISLELYKTRGELSRNESEKGDMEARWQVAQDMVSLASSRVAFEDCELAVGYDHTAIWLLNKLIHWILQFVKALMKECVLAATLAGPPSPIDDDDDDLFGGRAESESPSWDPPPGLLHFCHPFALQNFTVLLLHIKRFRNHIESARVPTEEWQVARHVLFDMIDYCPVDLAELAVFLKAIAEELSKLEEDRLDEAFTACKPTPALIPHLRNVCEKISAHPKLLDKARLFVEPYDLLEGVSRMSAGSKFKGRGVDIITKNALQSQNQWVCLRCQGRRRGGSIQSSASPRWKIWQTRFQTRCICGGMWSQLTQTL